MSSRRATCELLPMALVCLAAGCAAESSTPLSDLALLTTSMPARVEVAPDTREAFLDVLAPLPSDAIAVRYAVEGPSGIEGTLEIVVRPGGDRRESWTLSMPMPDGELRAIEESAVQTADYIWVGHGDSLDVQRAPLGALADAYLALDPEGRARVIASLRSFRQRLADAHEQVPGPTEQILGVPCLTTRLAAQELCVWEQTGLPLRFKGNAFSMLAVSIDLAPTIEQSAFAVPTEVEQAAPGPDLDPAQSLDRLAREDYAELGPLLHPGLRLPLG